MGRADPPQGLCALLLAPICPELLLVLEQVRAAAQPLA